jgi:hemerythrin-like domain-containing protein
MSKVLDIIRDEHRSIRAVLDGLGYLAHKSLTGKSRVDPRAFRAMLHYLETYAERMHHPKEDLYLFSALRQFGPKIEALVDSLESDHAGGERALRDLDHCLARCEESGENHYVPFALAVEDFVQGYLLHMRREEEEVFPLALQLLGPGDWAVIDRAFAENRDPVAAIREKRNMEEFLDRIVNLAPPPIGVGRDFTG